MYFGGIGMSVGASDTNLLVSTPLTMALVRPVNQEDYSEFLVAIGAELYKLTASGGELKHFATCGEVPESVEGKECEGTAFISGVASGRDGIVTCSNNKVLETWSWDGKRLASTVAVKRPTAVQVSPSDGRVVLSDKAGDAYSYTFQLTERRYLLGHVSVVMDCLMSKDGKHLVTCDRDEKIRVSHYPNCYNVQTYLMGHTEFVHGVVQTSDTNLASIGGDCTLRLWDLTTNNCTSTHTSTSLYTSLSFLPSFHSLLLSTADTISTHSASNPTNRISMVTVPDGVVSTAVSGATAVVLTPSRVIMYNVTAEGVIEEVEHAVEGVVKWSDMVVNKQPERKKPAGVKGFQAYFERKRKRIEDETAKAKVCAS